MKRPVQLPLFPGMTPPQPAKAVRAPTSPRPPRHPKVAPTVPTSLADRGFVEPPLLFPFQPRKHHPRQISAAADHDLPLVLIHEASGISFFLVPGGTFTIGAPQRDIRCSDVERRATREIGPFYMGTTPVTREQWRRVAHTDPSTFRTTWHHPVESVSFGDVAEFLDLIGSGIRLPTEAEWEHAARGGNRKIYWWGDDYGSGFACCDDPTRRQSRQVGPSEVGHHPANPYGLHDVLGNVAEWVADAWRPRHGRSNRTGRPHGTPADTVGVARGGSWRDHPDFLRCSCRQQLDRCERMSYVGFRVAFSVNPRSGTTRGGG